jgi:hypothetical protein
MRRNFNEHPSEHGKELADFLNFYMSCIHRNRNSNNSNNYNTLEHLDPPIESIDKKDEIDMDNLAVNLISNFFKKYERDVTLISPSRLTYYLPDYEYHIYSDKVKIIGLGYNKDYEVDWRTKDFRKFCMTIE